MHRPAESLQQYFAPFRANIIGIDHDFESPCGRQTILYADWTASGRMFGPIEQMLSEEIAPFVGNTHTETSVTGTTMTPRLSRGAQTHQGPCQRVRGRRHHLLRLGHDQRGQ